MPVTTSQRSWNDVTPLILAVVFISLAKGVVLALDMSPRLFLGDSHSYVHSAVTGWFPPDRSFVYPWLIRWTALGAESLTALIAFQTLCGVLAAVLLYAVLRAVFALPWAWATVIAVLFALDPAQLFYERMVMAEAAGGLALMLFIAALTAYCLTRRLWLIPLYVALGVLVVALRLNLLPVVLVAGLLGPLLSWCLPGSGEARGRRGLNLLLAVGAVIAFTVTLHGAYKNYVGAQSQRESAYIGREGAMRLGLVVPLVRPEHLVASGIGEEILAQVGPALDDHRARESHLWLPDGLIPVLERHLKHSDREAGKIAMRAVRADPFGVLRLGLRTCLDYFDEDVANARLHDDLGTRALPKSLLSTLRDRFGADGTELHGNLGPVARYFAHAKWWLIACYLGLVPAALTGLWLIYPRLSSRQRTAAVLLALVSLGLVLGQTLFSHIVSFRYLHVFPALMLCWLGCIGFALHRRDGRRRPAGPPTPARAAV